jgi:hypothetical protein
MGKRAVSAAFLLGPAAFRLGPAAFRLGPAAFRLANKAHGNFFCSLFNKKHGKMDGRLGNDADFVRGLYFFYDV